jgi:hypothetical protein
VPLTFSFPSPATFQAPAPNRTSSRRLLLPVDDDGDVGSDATCPQEAVASDPDDIKLLKEIRDLLASRQGDAV